MSLHPSSNSKEMVFNNRCLGGKKGGHDQISNKDAILFFCLANRLKVDFARIILDDLLNKLNKKTREKVVPYRRFIYILLEYMMPDYEDESLTILPTEVFSAYHWALKPTQPEGPQFIDHMLAICQIGVFTNQQAPNTSSPAEKKVSKSKKPGAKRGIKKHSSKNTFKSQPEATTSKIGHSNTKTQSSSAKDTHPSHPLSSTPVVDDMHKEDQNLHPFTISSNLAVSNQSVLIEITKSSRDGLNTVQTDIGVHQGSGSKNIKLEDLAQVMFDTRSDFFSDYYTEEPIIIIDESEEGETKRHEQTDYQEQPEDTSIPSSSSPTTTTIQELQAQSQFLDINQQTQLLVESLKPELSTLLTSHDFNSFIPKELKELPPKITALSGDVKKIQKHVQSLLEILGKLHDVPLKMETLTSNISSIASQIAKMKTHEWISSSNVQDLHSKLSSVQAKLPQLDHLPSLLNKVTDTLNRFADTLKYASLRAGMTSVPSAAKANTSPAKGRRTTNPQSPSSSKEKRLNMLKKQNRSNQHINLLSHQVLQEALLKLRGSL
ncbi:hypothetical protein Tco_1161280 [Tanacetum coccineum]